MNRINWFDAFNLSIVPRRIGRNTTKLNIRTALTIYTKLLIQSGALYAEKRMRRSKKSKKYTRMYHNFFLLRCGRPYVIYAHTVTYAIIFGDANAFPCVALHELCVFIVFKVIWLSLCMREIFFAVLYEHHICVHWIKRFSEWISFTIITGSCVCRFKRASRALFEFHFAVKHS